MKWSPKSICVCDKPHSAHPWTPLDATQARQPSSPSLASAESTDALADPDDTSGSIQAYASRRQKVSDSTNGTTNDRRMEKAAKHSNANSPTIRRTVTTPAQAINNITSKSPTTTKKGRVAKQGEAPPVTQTKPRNLLIGILTFPVRPFKAFAFKLLFGFDTINRQRS